MSNAEIHGYRRNIDQSQVAEGLIWTLFGEKDRPEARNGSPLVLIDCNDVSQARPLPRHMSIVYMQMMCGNINQGAAIFPTSTYGYLNIPSNFCDFPSTEFLIILVPINSLFEPRGHNAKTTLKLEILYWSNPERSVEYWNACKPTLAELEEHKTVNGYCSYLGVACSNQAGRIRDLDESCVFAKGIFLRFFKCSFAELNSLF